MDDVAGIAWKLPVRVNGSFAGFAGDPLVGVAIAVRLGDVLVAVHAEEFVFARLRDLAERQDPSLTAPRRTRLA